MCGGEGVEWTGAIVPGSSARQNATEMVAWITGELLISIASRCDATHDNASPWIVEAAAVISAAKGGWCVCARARVCAFPSSRASSAGAVVVLFFSFSRVVGWCRCRAIFLLLLFFSPARLSRVRNGAHTQRSAGGGKHQAGGVVSLIKRGGSGEK